MCDIRMPYEVRERVATAQDCLRAEGAERERARIFFGPREEQDVIARASRVARESFERIRAAAEGKGVDWCDGARDSAEAEALLGAECFRVRHLVLSSPPYRSRDIEVVDGRACSVYWSDAEGARVWIDGETASFATLLGAADALVHWVEWGCLPAR